MSSHTVIKNISELITLEPLTKNPLKANIKKEDLGLLKGAWLSTKNGLIHDYGIGASWEKIVSKETKIFDAKNSLVLPGLVDSHTHLLYGGDRSGEFAKRLNGVSYSEIAASGGGIYSTVKRTEDTSDKELIKLARERLETFLSYGVTTLEAKSGYSLTLKEELRQLKLLGEVKKKSLQELRITSLPLHAIPKDKKSQDYIKEVSEKLLTQIKAENLADYVDVFIEEGYYEAHECELFFSKAKELGLGIKIHADEFTRSGGAELAAKWGAVSADHLQFASSSDKKILAENKVVATILPGTSLYTKIPFTDAKSFIKEGCRVAIASDHNPGSCQLSNLPMLASTGALHCSLTAAQAVAAVTFMGASAIGLGKTKGALAKGYDADFILLPFESHESWLASFGEKKPVKVFIGGHSIRVSP